MIIAQVSDVHLGFATGGRDEPNRRRLDAVVAALAQARPGPDILFVTGDLTENGDVASYEAVREAFAGVACPVHYMLGNHDLRANYAQVWPDEYDDGFLQYVVDTPALRFVVLDTLDEGRHGGGFCERRGAWLRAALSAAPDRPTLVLLHHPPIPVGIAWMDCDPTEPWIERLQDALAGQGQVVGLVTGHLHRPIASSWAGLPLIIGPSSSPGLSLDLTPIDPDLPDGRAMIADDAPAYALHRWDGERLVTHFATTAERVLVGYTPALQPMVRGMVAERTQGLRDE